MPKTSKSKIEREQRKAKAIALRLEGKTVRAIADELNVSVGLAFKDIDDSLAQLRESQHHSAEKYLAMELARLDAAMAAIARHRFSAHPWQRSTLNPTKTKPVAIGVEHRGIKMQKQPNRKWKEIR
ncbi:hypothetical protein GS597_02180 [Synechococcales cyanobacterium C]|uniref:Uncharacterized protein n=1 Tax=Petrachloros mirabilis ULC683 TaxID=2781853 RepID=A0A8K2ABY0_9CYAN|nr:helix-turn-helix domain-containing protein [Petrachloros mirabilis]NCJ05339.1 hypothetical protein [Petrachloros mirabilis ULC683]